MEKRRKVLLIGRAVYALVQDLQSLLSSSGGSLVRRRERERKNENEEMERHVTFLPVYV